MEERIGQNFNVYSVKDELTRVFHQPICIKTDEEAIRWFKYVLNNTDIWKYNAAMYSLYKLGSFNDMEGLSDYNVAELVAGGISVLDKEE